MEKVEEEKEGEGGGGIVMMMLEGWLRKKQIWLYDFLISGDAVLLLL